ncbi:MAG: acyl-CoA dehydrogenase family protein [Ilumatobacter sp.]|uniref:acyl-CoA dehydrogenase family protein n=1 Tax=Ilumatobacter sp. TaxID=1967498 RepID=UPI003296826D
MTAEHVTSRSVDEREATGNDAAQDDLGSADHDSIGRAQRIADEVLFPRAQVVDRSSIPASHFDALRQAGLFSLDGLSVGSSRRAMAAIAGGCGATFFVWVQHHGVVRTVAASANVTLRTATLPALLDGSIVAGTAFAHVRRTGSTAVRATRVAEGWRLDGKAPWATSWGIAERFAVAATTDDGRMVWSMLPGDGGPGVTASVLALPVFSSTGTVEIGFDGAVVADADTIGVHGIDAWRAGDRRRASVGSPAILGVAARAIHLLRGAARTPDDPANRAAGRLTDELARRWEVDDEITARLAALPDEDPSDDDGAVGAASRHRAACLDLGQRATTALLAAVGGAGMDLSHPAQRLAREASFYVIQAQTDDGRVAVLDSV